MPHQHPNLLWVGRTFGIEMEFTKHGRNGAHITGYDVNRALTDVCEFPVSGTGGDWNSRSNGRSWEVQYDATSGARPGTSGWEVSSPALLLDEEGECAELKRGCDALMRMAPKISSNCGLHVHVDVSDFNWREVQKLLGLWARYEPFFYSLVPESRKTNHYCKTLRATTWENAYEADAAGYYPAKRALEATSRGVFNDACNSLNKYRTLRMEMWAMNGRVEFRIHGGTINYKKIRQWLRLVLSLVGRVKTSTMGTTGRLPVKVRPLSRSTGFGPAYVLGALGMGPNGGVGTSEATMPIYESLMEWIPKRQRKFHPRRRG